ncbi:MAG: nucleotidyl transferase AbiEii/AbiGii toxin family protein [Thermodesulfobacteriota bacterium]
MIAGAELDYRTIFQLLNDQGIDYLVVGGVAVNIHGVPRMTYDVDLMVSLERENLMRLVALMRRLGYRPRAPVDPEGLADPETRRAWVESKGMKAFTFQSHEETIAEIDVIIEQPIPYAELRSRATQVDIDGVEVPVVSLKDLIALKKCSGRRQDISDVEHLSLIDRGDVT